MTTELEPSASLLASSTTRDGLRALERAWHVLRMPSGDVALAPEPLAGSTSLGMIPALQPAALGSRTFRQAHRVRLAYMTGGMAGGIGSVELVLALGRAGLLGTFGAAGLDLVTVEAGVRQLCRELPDGPWAVNLIHTPDDPRRELAVVELLLALGVRCVEASAFMDVAAAAVWFRAAGLHDGRAPTTQLIVKLSSPVLAERFLSPPPPAILHELVASGRITARQAALAARLPVAQDITVEADSGGHTDGRPLVGILPAVIRVRDAARRHADPADVRIGAAGGIGSPDAAAAAFAAGADYVVTGSVNQACVEAGTSSAVKALLARVGWSDMTFAPAADMFEFGVQVQVLKLGTLFPMRARQLSRLYGRYDSLEALPLEERAALERDVFHQPLTEIWRQAAAYVSARDPQLLARAESDPKLRLALVFRWYLGQSSRWAVAGVPERSTDYQVWCGPAMAAFNEWTAGSALAAPAARRVVRVADAIVSGAAYLVRAHWLRCLGVSADPAWMSCLPEAALATPAAGDPVAKAPTVPAVATLDAAAIRDWLIGELADRLGIPADEIDPGAPFAGFAIDSAAALIVMARLERYLGRRLSPTLIWNYPTVDALAAHLGVRS